MQQNLNQLLTESPKQFCVSVNGGFNPEMFLMAMYSGSVPTVYALTPAHMKQLQQWIAHQISLYEKQHGEIKAVWSPSIPSPIPASDLKRPQKDEDNN